MKGRGVVVATLLTAVLSVVAPAWAQPSEAQERVAALKASLAFSQTSLRQYEWLETTTVRLKGEEKSRLEDRCYYGADGKLQKVPITAPPQQEKKRGVRGRVVERKKDELTDYMKEAVALVHDYVPPDGTRIEAVKAAGKLSIQPQGSQARLVFADYLKPGDSLTVTIDMGTNRLLGISVATYLGSSATDAVTLQVEMGTLSDGATYAASTRLTAPAKGMDVTVDNSGYRKTGS